MAIPKAIASIKRFGARYGRTVKHKFGAVEAMQRRKYKCPYCSKPSLKRVSLGIWQCRKCNAKIASRAYTVSKKKTLFASNPAMLGRIMAIWKFILMIKALLQSILPEKQ